MEEVLSNIIAISGIIVIICFICIFNKKIKIKIKNKISTKILWIINLIAIVICFGTASIYITLYPENNISNEISNKVNLVTNAIDSQNVIETNNVITNEEVQNLNDEINLISNSINNSNLSNTTKTFEISTVPAYSSEAYAVINNNNPYFSSSDLVTESYEKYSDLDSLGRCGVAIACVGKDIMPTEERGTIGSVKPSGWHTVRYQGIDGNYLYNRCHLIGYQLTGENANEKNLITGTRYLNIEGMLPFENMSTDYVKETGNHVMYRVTPIFEGNNLLASGVLMEAESVEDNGAGIKYCVYCYNVQPGIEINYETGESSGPEYTGNTENSSNTSSSSVSSKTESTTKAASTQTESTLTVATTSYSYVLNTNTKKFHIPTCSSVSDMKESNKKYSNESRDSIISQGYQPCKRCNP